MKQTQNQPDASPDLHTRTQSALADEFLRGAVRFTTDRLRTKKKTTTEEFGNWEEWRTQGQAIRAHTIAYLDYYLQQFSENAVRAGAHVHFAHDASEAVAIVEQVAIAKQAQLVVKSKSMVTEEIHLNHYLQKRGMRVVETDLGEYIVQLADDTPSHIIIPAIHKTREQIKELFTEDGGQNLTTETAVLTAYARQRMRFAFMHADIGVTGCNFAIAESGSIVLFTNEGNADMVVNLPDTHIVMMGMERILPTFADLEVMANLLTKSATGQNITAYMSTITGPRRKDEHDGAKEMHIIILDNGRSRQLGDPKFQEVLHCIRCGACLNVCPVYRQIGGHAYGSIYPGPIGAVLTPLLQQGPEFADLPYASSLCGACFEACPVKIPLHDMLVHLRYRNVQQKRTKRLERLAFQGYQFGCGSPRRYQLSVKTGRWLQKQMGKTGLLTAQNGPFSGWTQSRTTPILASQSFREQWPKLTEELSKSTQVLRDPAVLRDPKEE